MPRLHTLGRFELVSDRGAHGTMMPTQPKRLALLAYLATAEPRGPHRRDTLLGLLWPSLGQDEARRALRQSLHHLRQRLGDAALVTYPDDRVGLDPAALWCDAAELIRLADAGADDEVLALNTGPFLGGVYLPEVAPDFEQWVDVMRERVGRRSAEAAWRVSERLEREGDRGAAGRLARTAWEYTPDDEVALRRLLEVLQRTNDRAGALRVFDIFSKRLAAEYGATPAPATITLIERIRAAGASAVRPSVAVLPMVNTGGEAADEHFSDGLTDELIGALGRVPELTVAGRTSSFALRDRGLSISAIAATLGVSTVLEGSVRRSGHRLKASMQLVDADGSVLWSDSYDRTIEDVFAVQEEIAQAVVQALKIRLTARAPLVRAATADPAAYDLYLKGRFLRRRLNPHDIRRAAEHFTAAIAQDPQFASAHAWLSECLVLMVVFGGRPASIEMERAHELARRAVEIDPAVADAHWALAHVLFTFVRDWEGAGRAFRRALELDPGHIDARHMHGIYLLGQGRLDEARAEIERAKAADPLLAETTMTLGRLHLRNGDAAKAASFFDEALELAPAFAFARGNLGHCYLQMGRRAEAVAEFERAVATGAGGDVAQLAYAYAVSGRRPEALRLVDRLTNGSESSYTSPVHIAMAYVGLGDIDAAFSWLERGRDEHDPHVCGTVTVVPSFDPLRSDPRFEPYLRSIGL